MQVAFSGLPLVALLIPGIVLGQAQLLAKEPYLKQPTYKAAQLQRPAAKNSAKTTVPVVLPVSAKVWLQAGGFTTGQVKGLDIKSRALILGKKSMQIDKIKNITFDRTSLAYRSDGTIIIRGEDNTQAEQKSWQNIPLSAFHVNDTKLGQAKVNLDGVLKPLKIKGIRIIAKKSIYVVDEIQFQSDNRMTIKVKPADR